MTLRYDEIGKRLKAFRMASGMNADEIAQRIGISRTALYRFEKGELAKIETLEKLSELLNVSMPTLLGVGIEYMPSAVAYFERTRQLEETAEHLLVLAGPISFLLASFQFEGMLDTVLRESIPEDAPNRQRSLDDVNQIMDILHQRKESYRKRRPSIVNLISTTQIERFLQNGMAGRQNLPASVAAQRREMARQEVEHFVNLIEGDEIGVQIGLVSDTLPHNGFQIFRNAQGSTLTLSPFRLGEQPNIRVGVAMATSAPEALTLHQNIVNDAWRTAMKGPAAAAFLKKKLQTLSSLAPVSTRKRA
ncbi:helix-turn-helix domain-containing protein [Pigmentiphaga litoralis]|uniref:Transcriptional regulator with XRE-family HTH domain n=1 Tax=Pigmentiphaga litoralis TaxID=516702 RepID=A0A7Y9IRQ5_9BURK|nr:helix-turn-helix transcriptional regulator [Pigmentiphaga litoralis]NYE24579.1 transcriptional regulator with XRE-family HTH domain [Pigmentiphaga litoralis]NYE81807.1 transcriptional regulator with XRE-family HTH domain [Pigmentiphaga litoralis]